MVPVRLDGKFLVHALSAKVRKPAVATKSCVGLIFILNFAQKMHRMGGALPMGDRVSYKVFGRKNVLDKRTRPPVSLGRDQ